MCGLNGQYYLGHDPKKKRGLFLDVPTAGN